MSQARSILLCSAIALTLPFLMTGCGGHAIHSHRALYTVSCANNPYLTKYGCSVERIQEAAENGDADAQYALGYMYYYGIDTVRDRETAVLWIKRSADQGQPLAKKAFSLIRSGAKFTDLHHAVSGGSASHDSAEDDTPTPSNTIVQQKSTDITQLNSGSPTEPLSHHLPAYKQSKPVNTEIVGDNSTDHHPGMASIHSTKITDPRLFANAKPSVAKSAASLAENSVAAAQPEIKQISSTVVTEPNADHFTMQLMASDKLSDLKAFARAHNLTQKTHYYHTTLRGKPWYMLTYGKYNSESAAMGALAQLPRSLKAYHPWVKSFATIEEEVRLQRVVV